MYKIGVVGLGFRIETLLRTLLQELEGQGKLVAVVDKLDKTTLCERRPLVAEAIAGATFYETVEEMLDKEDLDGVMIGTRCSTHTKLACPVLEKGIPLFLEKPVCTTMEDWERLHAYEATRNHQVMVSFPLRNTRIVRRVREIVQSGAVGEIQHVQAVNNVPYGRVYYHGWYRNEKETGGLFLQKATHDFDYINSVINRDPVQVAAMGSKQIFKGDKPADLRCANCAEKKTCPEGPYMLTHVCGEEARGSRCCFAVDTGNHDSASCLVRYDSGMHLSYSQNFFARKYAQKRGATFMGYEGTVQFDFYTMSIQLFPHQSPRVETIQFDDLHEDHWGGDAALVSGFIDIMKGRPSTAPLHDGLMSALMCLKATESEKTQKFETINYSK